MSRGVVHHISSNTRAVRPVQFFPCFGAYGEGGNPMTSSHDNNETSSQPAPTQQQYREKVTELEKLLRSGSLSPAQKMSCRLRLSVIKSEMNEQETETLAHLKSILH